MSVVHRTVHHPEAGSLSTTVLDALDSLPDVNLGDSQPVLFDQIDPDALDALFRSSPTTERTAGQVRFPIAGYEVVVGADGTITIHGHQPASD
jgi:hypothetical protein